VKQKFVCFELKLRIPNFNLKQSLFVEHSSQTFAAKQNETKFIEIIVLFQMDVMLNPLKGWKLGTGVVMKLEIVIRLLNW
jgi:hypothetical protein